LRRIALLLWLLPSALFADEVFLKDAGSIEGRIVEQTATSVQVDVGGGIIGVPMDRVDHIVKGRSPMDVYDDRAAKLAPDDVAGWNKLGGWAWQQGLSTRARQAYEHVLEVAPNNPEANEALGMVQLNGKWVTEEESYQARGFVKYNGEWMTPAQAQVEQTQEANDRARRDAEKRARDAEIAAQEAQAQAKAAEEKAEQAQQAQQAQQNYYDPIVYGWGYGVTSWPAAGNGQVKIIPPSKIPVRTPR